MVLKAEEGKRISKLDIYCGLWSHTPHKSLVPTTRSYFDQYGIIRDVLQNHLLQVLTLLTMEAPNVVEGPGAGKAIRDAKATVLNAMQPIVLEDTVLGQYEGYADDPTIENKDTNTPTFAAIRLRINNPRWAGVPIILKAGKALNERKAEMRIQFKDAPGSAHMFGGQECPRNELGKRAHTDLESKSCQTATHFALYFVSYSYPAK